MINYFSPIFKTSNLIKVLLIVTFSFISCEKEDDLMEISEYTETIVETNLEKIVIAEVTGTDTSKGHPVENVNDKNLNSYCTINKGGKLTINLSGYYEIEYIKISFKGKQKDYNVSIKADTSVLASVTNFRETHIATYKDFGWQAYNGNSEEEQMINFKTTYAKAIQIEAIGAQDGKVRIAELSIYGRKI